MKIHDFEESVKKSEDPEYEAFWQEIYREAFPNLLKAVYLGGGNCQSQKLGYDRALHLSSGKELYLDEKLRYEVYNDIFLEYISVDTKGKTGWVEQDLLIDYLAYGFYPSRCCHLFPWHLLQQAWFRYKDKWIREYGSKPAKNKNYQTIGCPVPISTLKIAIHELTTIRL